MPKERASSKRYEFVCVARPKEYMLLRPRRTCRTCVVPPPGAPSATISKIRMLPSVLGSAKMPKGCEHDPNKDPQSNIREALAADLFWLVRHAISMKQGGSTVKYPRLPLLQCQP